MNEVGLPLKILTSSLLQWPSAFNVVSVILEYSKTNLSSSCKSWCGTGHLSLLSFLCVDNKGIVLVDMFIFIIINLKLGGYIKSKRSITSAVLQVNITWFYRKFYKSYLLCTLPRGFCGIFWFDCGIFGVYWARTDVHNGLHNIADLVRPKHSVTDVWKHSGVLHC